MLLLLLTADATPADNLSVAAAAAVRSAGCSAVDAVLATARFVAASCLVAAVPTFFVAGLLAFASCLVLAVPTFSVADLVRTTPVQSPVGPSHRVSPIATCPLSVASLEFAARIYGYVSWASVPQFCPLGTRPTSLVGTQNSAICPYSRD